MASSATALIVIVDRRGSACPGFAAGTFVVGVGRRLGSAVGLVAGPRPGFVEAIASRMGVFVRPLV